MLLSPPAFRVEEESVAAVDDGSGDGAFAPGHLKKSGGVPGKL